MGFDIVLFKIVFGFGVVGGFFFVMISFEKVVKNIVFVGGNNEFVDGEIYMKGEVISENVVKVFGRDSEVDFVVEFEGRGLLVEEGEIGVEVVDSLGENMSLVDVVDGVEFVG